MKAAEEPTVPAQAAKTRRFGIFHKLFGSVGALVFVVVTVLSVYFPVRRLSAAEDALETKATMYGRLVAEQVRSSVAFDDSETAREVFDAVSNDPDVCGLALLYADGRELHRWGTSTLLAEDWAPAKHRAGLERRHDRIVVVAPVVSLEGPRGTLIVEISTASLTRQRNSAVWSAAGAGIVAMALGAMVAWVLARSFARRLDRIARVATAVADGNLAEKAVFDAGRDEIGSLAGAFNSMLHQIQRLVEQIREQGRVENERLEARNADMRRVLDNVEQGLVTIDRDGRIDAERARVLDRWLGTPPASGELWEWLANADANQAAWGRAAWEEVTAGKLPLEVTIAQLPSRIESGGTHYAIEYRPIAANGDWFERMLVVISDVTAQVERERAEVEQRELAAFARRIVEDRTGSQEFLDEMGALIDVITSEDRTPSSLKREIHTVKGSAAIFGLESMSLLCHRMETLIDEAATLPRNATAQLRRRWKDVSASARTLLGERRAEVIELAPVDYQEFLVALDSDASRAELRRQAASWRLEPTATRLRRVGDHAERLAREQEKSAEVTVEDHRLRLRPRDMRTFWSAFTHLVRNAVDHGLESPVERRTCGKPERGSIWLRSRIDSGRLVIEIEDDGRGIDWDRVRARAEAMGLPATTQAELVDALCADGLTTRDEVNLTSGRGVGMAVVRQACRALGGELEVWSRLGEGTRVSISWSAAQLAFARTASPYAFSQPHEGPLSGSREQYVEGGF